MRRAAIAFALMIATAGTAAAETVVVGQSADRVTITSNFSGVGLTVFGSIHGAPAGANWDDYDIAVVLRGPNATVVARRKDSVVGLWVNRAEATFAAVPEFYAAHTTVAVDALADAGTLTRLGIGFEHLALSPLASPASPEALAFREALIRLKIDQQHFVEEIGTVENLGELSFRTAFSLPGDVPVGSYSATVHVFRDGVLVGSARSPLTIAKSSAEQFIYDASRNASWLYALAVVAMAASVGWLGGVIFRRD
jgi:uncharacterized protein (TIGR02186 family)